MPVIVAAPPPPPAIPVIPPPVIDHTLDTLHKARRALYEKARAAFGVKAANEMVNAGKL